jgi:hypothetical protein
MDASDGFVGWMRRMDAALGMVGLGVVIGRVLAGGCCAPLKGRIALHRRFAVAGCDFAGTDPDERSDPRKRARGQVRCTSVTDTKTPVHRREFIHSQPAESVDARPV